MVVMQIVDAAVVAVVAVADAAVVVVAAAVADAVAVVVVVAVHHQPNQTHLYPIPHHPR